MYPGVRGEMGSDCFMAAAISGSCIVRFYPADRLIAGTKVAVKVFLGPQDNPGGGGGGGHYLRFGEATIFRYATESNDIRGLLE